MIELSATVTSGEGSEKHNHSIKYRSKTLTHTHDTSEETVKELIPYEKTYQEQINELMDPYIKEYNNSRDAKLKEAWERYEKGEIQQKPKQKDYKHMDFDYYTFEQERKTKNKKTGKYEQKPVFRSLIIGIGDKNDKEKVSLEQAHRLFKAVTERFIETFPDFKVLGATLHADEDGFWHMHLDFFVLSEKKGKFKGLAVTSSLDTALQNMGYKPEQSIINGRDKVPILFNAMRNQIYYMLEQEMNKEGLYLQYGVSAKKEPNKNSSVNQKLDVWQETQDAAKKIQHLKNKMVAETNKDNDYPLSEVNLNQAFRATNDLQKAIESVQGAKRSRLNKNKVMVEFSLFDQIKSFLERIMRTFETFARRIGQLEADIKERDETIEKQNGTIAIYEAKEKNGKYYTNDQLKAREEIMQTRLSEAEGQRDRLWQYLEDTGKSSFQIGQIAKNYEREEEIQK